MAVINKIRSKSGLLIGIIGFSLVAFILGDFLSQNSGMFGSNDNSVGEIAGKKIDVQDFEARVQTLVNNYKLNSNTDNVDQNTMDQLREQAWNQVINEQVMMKQYDKIGLNVSPDELFDMVKGKNPHPQVKQAFTDPQTGEFNSANVINFLKNMDKDETGRTRAQWIVFERAIKDERVQQKYNDLVKQGLYVSTAEAKADWLSKNKTASVSYVSIPYATIADSTVEVTDAEMKTVYNANLAKYKQQATRGIEYVTWDVAPSETDLRVEGEQFEKLTEDFRTASNDSAFIAQNSDSPYNAAFSKPGTLAPRLDTVMFNSPVGTVVGPYQENNMFRAAKLSEVKMLPDSVKARHILLGLTDPNAAASVMAQADSIKNAIKAGADFSALSTQYSTDEAAKMKGGDLGWFTPGMMVGEFNDAAFNNNKGDVVIVQTQFGVHIMEITDQGKPSRQVKVVYLDKAIEPSTKTYQTIYHKANEFAGKHNTAEAFDKAVKEQNLNKLSEPQIAENAKQVGPLENSRELVRWAFDAEVGDISKAFEFGNRFVVAKLTDAREKGTSTMEQVKDQVQMEARRKKKASMLIEKINQTGKAGDLNALASALNQQVQTAENVSFASPYLGSAGMEAYVTGYIMSMEKDKVSKPLEGMNAVYVVKVNSISEPEVPKDFKDSATQLRQQLGSRSQYEVLNALKEKANIEDRRAKFY